MEILLEIQGIDTDNAFAAGEALLNSFVDGKGRGAGSVYLDIGVVIADSFQNQADVRISLEFIEKKNEGACLCGLITLEFQGVDEVFVAVDPLVVGVDIKIEEEAGVIVFETVAKAP